MSTDSTRPERSTDEAAQDQTGDQAGDQSGGQVSESAKPAPEVGGADATDKSTGTAPGEATEPGA